MEWRVRRIRPGEGGPLREVRLRALRDAPTAFASTYEAESTRPEAAWAGAASARAVGEDAATYVAEAGENWVGLVGGFRTPERREVVELVSLWVAPEVRQLGVGQALIDAIVAWAQSTGAEVVGLWVTSGNHAAVAAYRRAGFELTGDRQPLPSDPDKDELRMVLAVKEVATGRSG